MQLETEFSINSVIWLTSLPESEQGPTRRMVEAMESLRTESEIAFQHIHVESVADIKNLLEELTRQACNNGVRPLLHIDMHGNNNKGLYIALSSEYFSWGDLNGYFQSLNKATGNNLVVVGASCFGLKAVQSIKLDKPVPFFILLAPEEETHVGFLEDNIPKFYRSLFTSGSIDSAYSQYLSGEFGYFHCEKMLFIVIARYIIHGCKGKSANARREHLLTEVFSQGAEKSKENIKLIRKK